MSQEFISFLMACIIIELTPGPNMAYLTAISSFHGRKAGFSMVVGITIGLLVMGFVAGLGAAAMILEKPSLYQTIRWGGVAYLLWLAWDSWQMPKFLNTAKDFDLPSFRRGFITNVLNPKAALFYITVLPAFIDPNRPVMGQSILLTVVYVAIATIIHSGIVLLGDRAGVYLRNPKVMKISGYIFSALLLLIALWFAVSTHNYNVKG